jgi:BA14K-like protein
MTIQKSGGSVRKLVTRVLATGVLLVMYAFGMIAMTGALMTAGVSPAYAQRGRGRGGGDIGLGIGLGIGAAVIGGAIAAQQAQQQDAIGYCMQRFRSYDPESMTYVGRDGLRHRCP